jgi:hypothetical protein
MGLSRCIAIVLHRRHDDRWRRKGEQLPPVIVAIPKGMIRVNLPRFPLRNRRTLVTGRVARDAFS